MHRNILILNTTFKFAYKFPSLQNKLSYQNKISSNSVVRKVTFFRRIVAADVSYGYDFGNLM